MQLLQSLSHQPSNANVVMILCGVAKVFVGELVETGASLRKASCTKLLFLAVSLVCPSIAMASLLTMKFVLLLCMYAVCKPLYLMSNSLLPKPVAWAPAQLTDR